MQPIFDIEFEKDPEYDLDLLKNFNWVESIKENGKIISLNVKDINYAKNEILKQLSKLNNTIISYQIRKSTLEDIFIKTLNRNGII